MSPKARKRPKRTVTLAGPNAAHRVVDQKLWEEGRAKIAAAALPLFVQHGYHATPVRAIADAAGLSVGSVFNYFPEKDAILQHILDSSQAEAERAVAEAQERLRADDDNGDPVQLFTQVYRRFLDATDAIRRFALLAYQETKSLTPNGRLPLLEREHRIAELLKTAAQPAISAGIFSRAFLDLKVQALVVLGHAWAVRRWAFPQYETAADYFADLTPIALAIMKTGPQE